MASKSFFVSDSQRTRRGDSTAISFECGPGGAPFYPGTHDAGAIDGGGAFVRLAA
jgi:hypothetical protein